MFCLNHRSIKVTLFSEIHIKIISKISLTYHQIAFTYVKCIFKAFGKLDNYSCPIVYCCLITHKQGISLLFYLKKE